MEFKSILGHVSSKISITAKWFNLKESIVYK